MLERKAITGVRYHFWWRAPGYLTEAPKVTVKNDGVDVVADVVLSEIRPKVSIVSANQRDLTAGAAVVGNISGVTGARGAAFFVTDAEGVFDVVVDDIDGATVSLVDHLPRDASSGTLQWAWWSVLLDAAVTATAVRNLTVSVSYKRRDGADMPTIDSVAHGLLHVVDRPFDTGLDHEAFTRRWPGMSEHLHRRNDSFAPQIREAQRDMVIDYIRDPLAQRGMVEEDISLSGSRFRSAHMFLTRALVLENSRLTDDAKAARAEGERLAQQALKAIVAQIDASSGAMTDGPSNLTGPAYVDFGGGGFTA